MSPGDLLSIHIDGRPLRVEPDATVLRAARQHGIDIPTLCDFPGLPSPGSCRLCIVEVAGRPNTPTACTTPVEEGMVIYTHSPKVEALRADLLHMLLSEHPSACLYCVEKDRCADCMVTLRKAGVTTGCGSCPKDHQCELQALAARYGIEKPAFPLRYRMLPADRRDPFFDRDDNLCTLCGRCVRVCESLRFTSTLAFTRRGPQALVGTAFNRTHLESGCAFCGSCVEACPTGALSEKTRKWAGKPERETATTCPLCSAGCQIKLLSKQGRVIGSLPNRAAGADVLCVKGRFGVAELANHPTRLKWPQRLAGAYLEGISWEEAIQAAAERLAACPPGRFELRISASCTSEDLFVACRFTREVMPGGRVSSSALGLYGDGLGSVARLLRKSGPLETILEAPAVLCLGLDDMYARPVVEERLRRAKDRGCQIVQLGTRRPGWSDHADVRLPAAPGQTAALIRRLAALAEHGPAFQHDGGPGAQGHGAALEIAAAVLLEVGPPVVILGPAVWSGPEYLPAIEELVDVLGARVIALPDPSNLGGALRLGLFSAACPPESTQRDLDVLYLIGEPVPAQLSGQPFILYQNFHPPAGGPQPDLLLPTTAFPEERGTLIDSGGRRKDLTPAVPPPGEALPSWLILCRIAGQMGLPGFDYTCVEDIWRAAQAELPGFPELSPTGEEPRPGAVQADLPPIWPGSPTYMGLPLADWVEGLRSLYPEETTGSADEPHP
jgi:NADH dehydrogenase/NADH:ubiquinone oxidoreductase subunit G